MCVFITIAPTHTIIPQWFAKQFWCVTYLDFDFMLNSTTCRIVKKYFGDTFGICMPPPYKNGRKGI